MNCVANGKLHKSKIFKNIYIQPAAGDAGGSLGSALALYHMYFHKNRIYNKEKSQDLMKGSYLGPYYSKKEILIMNKKIKQYMIITKVLKNFQKRLQS